MSGEAALTIRASDLNEEQLQLAELIGLDNFKKLVLTFGGLNLYIPKKDSFNRAAGTKRSAESSPGPTSKN